MAEWKMSPTTSQNAPPPLTGSLQRTRILGGRMLLVYLRTVVTAIFDVMMEDGLGRVKIVTLRVAAR